MRSLTILSFALLVFVVSSTAEVVTSEKYRFVVSFPTKVSITDGKHTNGTTKTYQSPIPELGLLYMLTVTEIPALLDFKYTKEETKSMLLGRVVNRMSTTPHEETSFQYNWSKWSDFECIEFEYNSSTYIVGTKSYHVSKSIYSDGIFYTLSVLSTESPDSIGSRLEELIASFSVLSGVAIKQVEEESFDKIKNVPYLDDFDILGFRLGSNLNTVLGKTDLLLKGDYGWIQYFEAAQPPKSSIENISMGFVKRIGEGQSSGGNQLFSITIYYSKRDTEKILLKMKIPPNATVIEDSINEYGIYQYIAIHETYSMLANKKVAIESRVVDQPGGKMWISHTVKEIAETINER